MDHIILQEYKVFIHDAKSAADEAKAIEINATKFDFDAWRIEEQKKPSLTSSSNRIMR